MSTKLDQDLNRRIIELAKMFGTMAEQRSAYRAAVERWCEVAEMPGLEHAKQQPSSSSGAAAQG